MSRNSITGMLSSLLEKMKSLDSDLRLMALIDLNKELQKKSSPTASSSSSSASSRRVEPIADESTEIYLVTMVLGMLSDSNAEVKNMSVTCLAGIARRAGPKTLDIIVNELLADIASSDEEKRDIAALALKSVVQEISNHSPVLPGHVDSVVSRIFAILTKPNPNPQLASDLLPILTDIYTRFSTQMSTAAQLQNSSLTSLIQILSDTRPSIQKRAIPALVALIPASDPSLFTRILKPKILAGLQGDSAGRKTWVGVLASLARGQSVGKIGGLVDEVTGLVLDQTENVEDNEAVEGALVALEILVLRCPAEITPFVSRITTRAVELVKYDPNYVELNDDVDMDGEDDDFDDDVYSDDEDVSWKIRRAAAKVIYSLIGTRNELLIEFYTTVAPTLTSRFSEREESVRIEILAAFQVLLKQTLSANAAERGRNKRKWSQEMDEDNDTDVGSISYLRAMLPTVLRALLKQALSKSVSTRQECFVILQSITETLDGGLEGEADAVCAAAVAALRFPDATSSLTMATLSFLAKFFSRQSARSYSAHLPDLVPSIIGCLRDKLQHVSFDAFAAASALAQSVRPISTKGSASPLRAPYTQPIQQIFVATTNVLADPSIDNDVREKALETLGNLLVHEGDSLAGSYSTCLPLITARLANENTSLTAVLVIGKIAESTTCKGEVFESWLLQVLPEVVVALRRNKRPVGRASELACLSHVLTRVGSNLPLETAQGIVTELKPYIETPNTLPVIALVLTQQPQCRPTVNAVILPAVLETIKTPTVNLNLVESLSTFFGAYVDGDIDCATRLVPALVDNLGKNASLPDAGGTLPYTTTAKCIGVVVQHSQRNAAGVMAMLQKTIKGKGSEADVYLALLCVGEIGRLADLCTNAELFERILSLFGSESEQVQSGAAFAAGNMAVGSPSVFLPALIKRIESSQAESGRILLLHALKEVILHSPPAQLENLANSLWHPLFADDQSTTAQGDIGDDGIRNVKAACIGKLTTTAPAKFLPELQKLLHSSPRNRAIVAAAIRYTFIDTSSSYDELIAPIVVDFLSLIQDGNLIVRRLSLASLNAAIQNKPHLIIERLGSLQPLLYQETVQKPELCREVVMGPFKVIEDDGLENRKTAYETMYTLLSTCFSKIDLPAFIDRVMAALADVNEIKVLGFMLLLRLGQLAPTAVIPRLDEVVPSLQETMKGIEVKDDTIKQDLERKEEIQRSTLRAVVPLYRMSNFAQAPAFSDFVKRLLDKAEWKDFKDYQA